MIMCVSVQDGDTADVEITALCTGDAGVVSVVSMQSVASLLITSKESEDDGFDGFGVVKVELVKTGMTVVELVTGSGTVVMNGMLEVLDSDGRVVEWLMVLGVKIGEGIRLYSGPATA